MNEILVIKIVFIFAMLFSASLAGFMPLFVPAFHKSKKFLTLGNCFAAGIFIITGLAGLLPDAQKSFEEDLGNGMPLAYVLAGLGYLIIFFIGNVLFSHSHSLDEEEVGLTTNPLINNDEEGVITNKEHADEKEVEKEKIVSASILSGALVVHSTFEGIALGLLSSKTSTVTLCSAVLIHNIPAAIALGIKMKGIRRWIYSALMGAFVASSPFSIMIGIFLSDLGYPSIQGAFLSISAGTFIYIGCTEILPEELHNEGSKLSKFLAFCIGCIPLGIFLLFISE